MLLSHAAVWGSDSKIESFKYEVLFVAENNKVNQEGGHFMLLSYHAASVWLWESEKSSTTLCCQTIGAAVHIYSRQHIVIV